MTLRKSVATLGLLLQLTACASYRTPGGPVSIPEFTDANVAEALNRKPAASFPARLIIARVQASGYESLSNRGYGKGAYTLLTTRDIEKEEDFARLAKMPGVIAVGALSRLLLPSELENAGQLRAAAAQLHGDILLLYTLDTSFRTDTQKIGPLQLVSLGFFPNKKSQVTATCSVAFMDVRTGFIYGVAESTATESQRSDLWGTQNAIDKARLAAERGSFSGALSEIERTWASIYGEHQASSR